jgi:hypothetical protein
MLQRATFVWPCHMRHNTIQLNKCICHNTRIAYVYVDTCACVTHTYAVSNTIIKVERRNRKVFYFSLEIFLESSGRYVFVWLEFLPDSERFWNSLFFFLFIRVVTFIILVTKKRTVKCGKRSIKYFIKIFIAWY